LKQQTVTYLFVIFYEAFFKKEHLGGGGEKHSPDLQEPIFNFLVAAERSEAAPSLSAFTP